MPEENSDFVRVGGRGRGRFEREGIYEDESDGVGERGREMRWDRGKKINYVRRSWV